MGAVFDNDFEIFFTNILGFDAAKRDCITREVYTHADTFVGWKFKETKQWCDEVSKIHVNASVCLWGNPFAKIL